MIRPLRLAFFFGLIALTWLNTSCLRTSTVVEVGKDGTGEIVARYYFSPQVSAMIAQMEVLGGGGAGIEGLPDFSLLKEVLEPKVEDLQSDAANFGEGVAYASHEKGADEDGWQGYSVVYRFEDISKVKIDQNSAPTKAQQFVESSGQKLPEKEGGNLTFSMEGNTLTIHSSLAEGNMENLVDKEQLRMARESGVNAAEAIQAASAMMEGMRAGFFVRARDPIASTSAEHSTGNLIIMSEAEVAKVMQDEDFIAFLKKYSEDPEILTAEAVKELFGKIEAMTIELAETVEIEFE